MWPKKNFPGYGARWGAIYLGKSGGGRSNFQILRLVPEIPVFEGNFLLIAGGTKIGFRTLPESSNIFVGVTPPHLAATAGGCRYEMYLVYVVEGHASACPQTVGVGVKYVALTLIKLYYDVSAYIIKRNNQFELLLPVIYNPINTICLVKRFSGF